MAFAKRLFSTLLQFALFHSCHSSEILCGDVMNGSIISTNEPLKYELVLNHSFAVNFQSCDSSTDIAIFIYLGSDLVSSSYCPHGDDCGECANGNTNFAENFTMPMYGGWSNRSATTYRVEIGPYGTGQYRVGIECNALSNTSYISPLDTTTLSPIGSYSKGILRANTMRRNHR